MSRKIIVVGAGASGMCAAITAARKGAKVTLIEKNDIAGKKISMTGNGRCNITNEAMDASCYNSSARCRMAGWLKRFGTFDTIEFMKSLGVVTTSEEGYIYPISGQATTVQNALFDEVKRLGIKYQKSLQLKKIIPKENGDLLVKTSGDSFEAQKVIIATGALSGPKSTMSTGDGYYILKNLGMKITDTYPALVSLLSDDKDLPSEYGVRMMANVSIEEISGLLEYGEVQLTSKGISGIPVLQLSGEVSRYFLRGVKSVTAVIDFFPLYSDEEFAKLKDDILATSVGKTYIQALDGICNHLIGKMILSRSSIIEDKMITKDDKQCLSMVIDKLRCVKINVIGTAGYLSSQVTGGGVCLDDISDDFEYTKVPGIYVVGELLDVDGRCGGYNLQWAFTSGSIAGSAAAET